MHLVSSINCSLSASWTDSFHKKLDLAKKVKEGCREEGLVGLLFNTIGVRSVQCSLIDDINLIMISSDAITMGTDGMFYAFP